MKKINLAIAVALIFSSPIWAESIKITTTTSATADKVGEVDRPGLLFKFELPEELEGARIDLAYLRFKVEADSAQEAIGLLVRPMVESWSSGSKLASLSGSTASPHHANFGRLSFNSGSGKIEITQAVKAWQSGELPNRGLLVYPDEEKESAFQLKNLPNGGVAELEIFYTGAEKK
ncbi:MAG: hypothetical protein L0Z48_03730 [candidate division Zixibacteria bacterium]|nr:hypothetical protein [candidate division Zixibacteria bacterium]MCI0595637.1 hypothetical protein [candidate division Zixibacteria bacterium]